MSIKYQAVVLRYCRIFKVTNDIAVDLATFRSYIQLIRLPSSVLVEGRVTKDLNIFCETERAVPCVLPLCVPKFEASKAFCHTFTRLGNTW